MSAFRSALAPLDVTPRQFATMRGLAQRDGQSQRELSEGLHIPPSRLVALLDDLEEQGLVERQPHSTDRRTRCIHLTEQGHSLLAELLDVAAAHERRILAGLTTAERRTLDSLLGRIADNLALAADEHPGMRG
jgi:DNA-binding MarR family transcriptional regulator